MTNPCKGDTLQGLVAGRKVAFGTYHPTDQYDTPGSALPKVKNAVAMKKPLLEGVQRGLLEVQSRQ
jgi:hypothetical protein